MAVEEAELRIVLRAIATDLLAGMQQSREAVDRATASIRGDFQRTAATVDATTDRISRDVSNVGQRVTLGFSGIQGQIRAFGELAQVGLVVLGVVRAVQNITNATQLWATQTDHLNDSLKTSAEDTAALAIAAQESELPIERLDALVRGLGLHLNTSEREFKNLGITVRDSVTGNFRPMLDILKDIVATIQTYKGGADQLIVGQRLLGRGADADTIDGLRKTIENFEHARQVARDFGLAIGEDGVLQAEQFAKSQADVGFALLAVKNQLGGALRPEIEKLLTKLREMGRDGSLRDWAKEAAEGAVGVGDSLVTLGEFLFSIENFLKTGAIAWALYRASLIASAEWDALVNFLGRVRTAIAAISAAQTAQGVANLATGMTQAATAAQLLGTTANVAGSSMLLLEANAAKAGTALVATGGAATKMNAAIGAALASLGPGGIVAVAATAGVALLTFADRWDIVTDAVRTFGNTIRGVKEEIAALRLKDVEAELAAIAESTAPSESFPEGRGSGATLEQKEIQLRERVARLRAERDQLLGRVHTEDFEDRARFDHTESLRGGASVEGGGHASFETTPDPAAPPPPGIPPSTEQQIAAQKGAYDALKERRDQDLEEHRHDAEERLRIAQRFYAEVRKLAVIRDPVTGEAAADAQRAEALRGVIEAERKAEEQKTRITLTGLRERAEARLKDLAEQEKLVNSKVELGTIPVADAVVQLRQIADERLRIANRLSDEELKLAKKNPEELARIDADRLRAHDAWAREYAEIERKAAKASLDEWSTVAKDIQDAFSILVSALKNYITSLFTGATSDVTALRDELKAATRDVQYFRAIGERGTDEAINAKQREIDAQHQLNDALDATNEKTQALRALQREVLSGALGMLGDILIRLLQIQAIEFLTGEPASTKGGTIEDQFAAAIGGGLSGLFGGKKGEPEPAPEAPTSVPEAVVGAGTVLAPDTSGLIDAATQTEEQLTGIAAQGLATREANQSTSLSSMLSRWLGFGDAQVTDATQTTTQLGANQTQQVAKATATQAALTTTETSGTIARTTATTTAEATKTTATVAGEGARVAAVTSSTATKTGVETAGASKSLAASAAEAAGKIVAAFANLPLGTGIALGLAAAAAIVGIIKGFGVFHQGGIVPETGPIIAEKGERVLTVEETEKLEERNGKGTSVGPGAEESRTEGTPNRPAVEGTPTDAERAEKGQLQALGAAASAAGVAGKEASRGGGGGAGTGIQRVSVVSHPATAPTQIQGGNVTISDTVGVSAGDEPLPVAPQGIQSVAVVNTPLRVTFTMFGLSTAIKTPDLFGFIPSTEIGIHTAYAFEKGGRVPSTGPHLLHEGEFVLPAGATRFIDSQGDSSLLNRVVAQLTGASPDGVDPIEIGGPASSRIRLGGPRIDTGLGGPGTTVTENRTIIETHEGPRIDVGGLYAIDAKTGAEFLEGHMERIARGVAKTWGDRPGGRRP